MQRSCRWLEQQLLQQQQQSPSKVAFSTAATSFNMASTWHRQRLVARGDDATRRHSPHHLCLCQWPASPALIPRLSLQPMTTSACNHSLYNSSAHLACRKRRNNSGKLMMNTSLLSYASPPYLLVRKSVDDEDEADAPTRVCNCFWKKKDPSAMARRTPATLGE